MRAMRVHELGHGMQLDEVPAPEPGPGEVLVEIHACGVNFGDTLMVEGRYQEKFPLPFVPGMEICGTVRALGEGVEGLTIGTRIASYAGSGGFAEIAAIPVERCVPVPASMPDEVAAGFLVSYGTSHVALDYRARLAEGETLLVLGAAGGVGLTAVEIGALMGARVIACARGADRLEVARQAGAAHLIDSGSEDIRAAVKALGGADVCYDPVGGAQFDAALRVLRPEGRIIPLGFASGEIPQIPANIVLVKNIDVMGVYWGGYASFRPQVLTDSFRTLFDWYEAGRLRPHVGEVLPLVQANEALGLLRERRATGKIVVRVDA